MNQSDVQLLVSQISEDEPCELIETHISWILLTGSLVYKIKKPVRFSFLDFSNLEKRHYFCQREVELNRRLAPDMYLGVSEIRKSEEQIGIDHGQGRILDYAVRMKQIDGSKQMNQMLSMGEVEEGHMDQIAEKLSFFHIRANVFHKPLDPLAMLKDYADIIQPQIRNPVGRYIRQNLGMEAYKLIEESVSFVSSFLQVFKKRLAERSEKGFVVDGHGDLHSRNIFLLDEPLIFDCIEFNDHFRCLDVLDELAFFCMDLDLFDRPDLAERFLHRYGKHYPCIEDELDLKIFQYYKLYRSNVKIKVNVLKAIQSSVNETLEYRNSLIGDYFSLFERYFNDLRE